jgi:hypothetical protein
MKTMKIISLMAAVFTLAITGCKKDDINDPGSNNVGGRQFNVNMTDAPANFARMVVTIDGVEAYHDSQGWVTLSSNSQSINVLTLSNGASTNLAAASNVETGHYSRLRLHFSDANNVTVHSAVTIGTLFIAAGSTTDLTWGGPANHWVEIAIDREVSATAGAEVLIDFDAAASVQEGNNSYRLNPEIREMKNISTGARGTVTGTSGAAFVTFSDGTRSYSAYASASGSFLVRGMQPGRYTATIWAPVRNEAGVIEERKQLRSDIVVTNGTYVNIGAVHF